MTHEATRGLVCKAPFKACVGLKNTYLSQDHLNIRPHKKNLLIVLLRMGEGGSFYFIFYIFYFVDMPNMKSRIKKSSLVITIKQGLCVFDVFNSFVKQI